MIEKGRKYKFTEEDLAIVQAEKSKNKDRRIDIRLTVLEMSAQGIDMSITGRDWILRCFN